jgi:hypothetical protein
MSLNAIIQTNINLYSEVKSISLLKKALATLNYDFVKLSESNGVTRTARIVNKETNGNIAEVIYNSSKENYKINKMITSSGTARDKVIEKNAREEMDLIKQAYNYFEVQDILRINNYTMINKKVENGQIVLKVQV